MTISDSSTSLRVHVDAALDPIYEQMFGAVDLLLVHRTRPDNARICELRELLEAQLAELERNDRSERAGPPQAEGGEVPFRGTRRRSQ